MSIPLREPDLIPVDKRLALVRLLSTIISAAITSAMAIGAYFTLDFAKPWMLILALLFTLGGPLVRCIFIFRQVSAMGYKVRPTDLLIESGIMYRRTAVVPYARMQYVDVTASPLERFFGLATVTLHTASAGSDATVPGLKRADADRLRELLSERGQSGLAGL